METNTLRSCRPGRTLLKSGNRILKEAVWNDQNVSLLLYKIPDTSPHAKSEAQLLFASLKENEKILDAILEHLPEKNRYEILAVLAPVLPWQPPLTQNQAYALAAQLNAVHKEGYLYGPLQAESLAVDEQGEIFLLPSEKRQPALDTSSDSVQLVQFMKENGSFTEKQLEEAGKDLSCLQPGGKIVLSSKDLKEDNITETAIRSSSSEEDGLEDSRLHALFDSAFNALSSLDPNGSLPVEKSTPDFSGMKTAIAGTAAKAKSVLHNKQEERKEAREQRRVQEEANPVQLEKKVIPASSRRKVKQQSSHSLLPRRKRRRFFTFGRIVRLAFLLLFASLAWKGYQYIKTGISDLSQIQVLEFLEALKNKGENLMEQLPESVQPFLPENMEDPGFENLLPEDGAGNEPACGPGHAYDAYSESCQPYMFEAEEEDPLPEEISEEEPDSCTIMGGQYSDGVCIFPDAD